MEERRGNNKGEMNMWVKEEESTLDWRGRPSNPNKHGGMKAAAFVLGLFSFINLSTHAKHFSFSFFFFFFFYLFIVKVMS